MKYFMVYAFCIGAVLYPNSTFAQIDKIQKRLKEFNVDDYWLSSNLREEDAIHYYKVRTETGSNHGNVTSIAEYDPRRKENNRLKLLKIDGHTATKQEEKKYYKRVAGQFKGVNGKVDPTSYKIIKDNSDWFVVDFLLEKESLPEHYKFLGDCTAELHCRKDIMKASFARFKNFKPTKVRMFDADEVDIEVYFKYDKISKSYIHEEAHYSMQVKMLGIPTEIEMINYYSDYEVVK